MCTSSSTSLASELRPATADALSDRLRAACGHRLGYRALMLALVPLCVGWQGGGSGAVRWSRGSDELADADVKTTLSLAGHSVEAGCIYLVGSVPIPDEASGGDGVVSLTFPPSYVADRRLKLPDSSIQIRYVEYDQDGRATLTAPAVVGGHLSLVGSLWKTARLNLALELGRTPHDRRLIHGQVRLDPSQARDRDTELARSADNNATPVSTGCGGTWTDDWDDEEDDGGCGGDDLDDDSGSDDWNDDGGCGGDEVATDWDDPSEPSGCEGDSAEPSEAGCEESCSGDAMASSGVHRRRSRPFAARLVGWLPWMGMFAFVRISRRLGGRRRRGLR